MNNSPLHAPEPLHPGLVVELPVERLLEHAALRRARVQLREELAEGEDREVTHNGSYMLCTRMQNWLQWTSGGSVTTFFPKG